MNGESKLDLLGGHEWETGTTALFINPGNNDFAAVSAYANPDYLRVVLDFTVAGQEAAECFGSSERREEMARFIKVALCKKWSS